MELKNYQKTVMRDLTSYISILNDDNDLNKAWRHYWREHDIPIGIGGVPAYQNTIAGVPHVCMKVPTGGGKTFMACAAIRRIFNEMPSDKPKVVVWLVPSDPILVQTQKNLMNPDHPYRQRLNADFAGRVGVYTKEMLLNGQNFTPDTVREQLTVCILSYGSLRINSSIKDVRKVYQENGNLLRFASYFKDDSELLADTPDTALIQVLRHLQPIVIVDESHNAGSDLSIEMLNNLNPSFILDLTATPRKSSNIISYVNARELKKEKMVKLPVIVYNRTSRNSVLQDAIQLRNTLEQQAIAEERAGGQYIRPIVLFQAQPKNSDDNDTFEKVKEMLIEIGIPTDQIAIKTSKVDDLGKIDLLDRNCPIRYIITVNALKEGWDCPFAYILASLANKTSKVDVEQILGRILRQPYASEHKSKLLNMSFVLTCSNDFRNTLENIVVGLNSAGFSGKDYRIGENLISTEDEKDPSTSVAEPPSLLFEEPENTSGISENDTCLADDDFSDIDTTNINVKPNTTASAPPPEISDMISHAEQQSDQYEEESEKSESSGFIGGELGNMMKQYHIQPQYIKYIKELRIPQFFIQSKQSLFFGNTVKLEKEALLEGFTLSGQEAKVNFALSSGEMYEFDVSEHGDAVPKYKRASKLESDYLRDKLSRMAPEEKIKSCTESICHIINRNNAFATSDIEDYVKRVISNMNEDELSIIETSFQTYAKKIKDKIEELQNEHRRIMFYKWLETGKICCQDEYEFPDIITPSDATSSIPLSLYEAECDDVNDEEAKIRDIFASSENVEWWHRIIERKGFCINSFINHYPDFIVKMKSGRILLIESKGDYLGNDDSELKLELGKRWADEAGKNYRYYMFFKDKPIKGAKTLDEFAELLRDL